MNNFEKRKFLDYLEKLLPATDTNSYSFDSVLVVKHIDYIHYNSMKHYGNAPKNWEFSSFHRYVENGYYEKDWCNFEDIHKINELDLE